MMALIGGHKTSIIYQAGATYTDPSFSPSALETRPAAAAPAYGACGLESQDPPVFILAYPHG